MVRSFDSPLPGWLARCPAVSLAAVLYGTATGFRNNCFDRFSGMRTAVRKPVVSVGGIRAGGSGKTPTVMLLTGLLQEQGYQVGVLSRGFRRRGRKPIHCSPDSTVDWRMVGDEPAMIKNAFPGVWLGIGADRAESAAALQQKMGIRSVFLLDDGYQHRKLHRDVDIVCIHESVLRDRCIPQGYLREPVRALKRADLFFLISSEQEVEQMKEVGSQLKKYFPSTQQFLLTQHVAGWVNTTTGEAADTLPFTNPVVLCGIARPDRFLSLLSASGITPAKTLFYPDHHPYTEYDILSLRELYSQGLVTTEKDAIRMQDLSVVPAEGLWYLKMRLNFRENDSLNRFNHYITSKLAGSLTT